MFFCLIAQFSKRTILLRRGPFSNLFPSEKGSVSLNCLEKEPNLFELIPTMLRQFRRNRIWLTADARQALFQISRCKIDSFRFLWYENGKEYKTKIYRVAFGINSSQFLLNATIYNHL